MAETNIKYGTFVAMTVTAWTTTLAAGDAASSAIVDNTSNLYIDALVGGIIEGGASHTAGDTFDIYAYANYDTGTSTDLTGGIDALFAGSDQEEADGTDIELTNMPLLGVVTVDQNAGFHFGPWSVAAAFQGVLPPKWGVVGVNNGTGALASGSTCGYTPITYTTA